ncbi:MAG: hypothetical protein E7Z85_03135 [Methanosphaera stadtmanae]|nr:hypothetical protein [Methanosphaera stadtmanae]
MKIINDENGYITSILLLIILIPVLLLLVITIDEYSDNVNNTVETLESNQIISISEDFENEIMLITKDSLHNITYDIVTSRRSITNRDTIKKYIQHKIDDRKISYNNTDFLIECKINDLKPSNNPFKVEIDYTFEVTTKNNKIKNTKNEQKLVEITDKKFPVYDPLPTLKTGATFNVNNINFGKKLSDYINLDNADVYLNTIQTIIIRECPLNDYTQHGNSNETIFSCLNNHYYHNSHDGMCIFCRLENKTDCNHYGFETFILPTKLVDEAPVSIDHVLLNDRNNQYSGNLITIENDTFIYLDNGHKSKYGL